MSGPRGSIVAPTRPIPVGGGWELTGRKAGAVAYLGGTRGERRAFLYRISLTPGIVANVVQRVGDKGSAMGVELVGSPELVAAAVELSPVVNWHYILDVPTPRGGVGTGEPKARPARPKQRLTLDVNGYVKPACPVYDKAQRAAVDERSRQQRIRLAEGGGVE